MATDFDRRMPTSAGAGDYSQLSDAQLRSGIRFAEQHIQSIEADHVELLRAYRDEVDAMRRHLLDRVLRRMVAATSSLSDQQRRDVRRALDRCRMQPDEIAAVVRAATYGRTDQLDALTEIEAMALLLRLEQGV
jgi:hypothetical protein